ncbi:MAG TPA: hypothetical protein VG276_04250 [Actinomycetes bacterium]|nr:hypothetical protein [Actinomycetes bacterium]
MKFTKVIITRIVPVLLVAGLFVAVPASPASAGTRTPRLCDSYYDGVWKLDFCSGGWYDGDGHARAVVDMHTYHWQYCPSIRSNCWLDSQSQSITMNTSEVQYLSTADWTRYFFWGQNQTDKCRVNSPTGTVACSVANVVRVTFYSKLFTKNPGYWYVNRVEYVSWRDASGQAHGTWVDLWSPVF